MQPGCNWDSRCLSPCPLAGSQEMRLQHAVFWCVETLCLGTCMTCVLHCMAGKHSAPCIWRIRPAAQAVRRRARAAAKRAAVDGGRRAAAVRPRHEHPGAAQPDARGRCGPLGGCAVLDVPECRTERSLTLPWTSGRPQPDASRSCGPQSGSILPVSFGAELLKVSQTPDPTPQATSAAAQRAWRRRAGAHCWQRASATGAASRRSRTTTSAQRRAVRMSFSMEMHCLTFGAKQLM